LSPCEAARLSAKSSRIGHGIGCDHPAQRVAVELPVGADPVGRRAQDHRRLRTDQPALLAHPVELPDLVELADVGAEEQAVVGPDEDRPPDSRPETMRPPPGRTYSREVEAEVASVDQPVGPRTSEWRMQSGLKSPTPPRLQPSANTKSRATIIPVTSGRIGQDRRGVPVALLHWKMVWLRGWPIRVFPSAARSRSAGSSRSPRASRSRRPHSRRCRSRWSRCRRSGPP
jgi:hypothetical protein